MNSVFPQVKQANEYGVIALGGSPNPALLIDAYSHGIFPWPHPELEELPWFAPPQRAILFWENFLGMTRIRRYIKKEGFQFTCNTQFSEVMRQCAKPTNRSIKSTWITDAMIDGYSKLHKMGFAHSIEVLKNGELAGGLYGVSIGKMFAAESMFYRVSNASKAALVALNDLILPQGAQWIDCQQLTSHLSSLGGIEISREDFMILLKESLKMKNMVFSKGQIY